MSWNCWFKLVFFCDSFTVKNRDINSIFFVVWSYRWRYGWTFPWFVSWWKKFPNSCPTHLCRRRRILQIRQRRIVMLYFIVFCTLRNNTLFCYYITAYNTALSFFGFEYSFFRLDLESGCIEHDFLSIRFVNYLFFEFHVLRGWSDFYNIHTELGWGISAEKEKKNVRKSSSKW